MVLPFLGVYMTSALKFSLTDAGIVLSCYGFGAIAGSVLGGWLTDRFGPFKVQLISLLLAVPMFAVLPNFTKLESLAIAVFILSIITDTFRPANSVSVAYYARPENITRAFSLNRMAINLGFSIGPAMGGALALISYSWLFYGNAFVAFAAALVFYFYFKDRKGNKDALVKKETTGKKPPSPYKDKLFIVFNILCSLYAICFFQLLSTLPLFYREVHLLSESTIGVILGFSGLVVFALEMILVHIAEKKMTASQVLVFGTLLCGISFAILNIPGGILILYISIFVLCVSEMLAMPFIATVTTRRSIPANRGAYMGFGSLGFAIAHVVSPFTGTHIAHSYGFDVLWYGTFAATVLISAGFYFVMKRMDQE